MPNTIEYSESPNVETAFVVREDGKKNRAVLTAAQDTSTLEYPTNPNSTKGYVTINGKKHRVVLTAEVGGGSSSGGVTSVNGMTGDVTLGINDVAPEQSGFSGYVLGTDGSVAGWVKPEMIQRSAMPQASEEEAGKIYQFVGTTDSNYTNGYFYKCVANYSEASATVTQSMGNSLSDLAVDVDTLEAYLSPTGDLTRLFRFYDSFDGQTNVWACVNNSQIVNLADFGISYTGTPVDQDAIYLVYTAPALTGYTWERVDVQPEGATGIKWAVILDKPEITDSMPYWNATPVWVIAGGLPDGDYEFFFRTRISANSHYNKEALVTYKVAFTLYEENGHRYCDGSLSPIIDGYWNTAEVQDYEPKERYFYNLLHTDQSGNFIISLDNAPFTTQMNNSDPEVLDAARISNIRNLTTGEEYVPTGHWYGWDDYNAGWTDIDTGNGYFRLNNLLTPAPQQTYWYAGRFEQVSQYEYFVVCQNTRTISRGTPDNEAYVSELDISIECETENEGITGEFHVIIENTYTDYTARIIKQSGDLAGLVIGDSNNGTLIHLTGIPNDGKTRYYRCFVGTKGSNVTADMQYFYYAPVNFKEITLNTVGADITPKNLGVVVQYNEEIPNVAYTKGYFYEATGTIVTVPTSMPCTETSSLGVTITCADPDGFAQALAQQISWNPDYIKELLANTNYNFEYDVNSNHMNWSAYGSLDATTFMPFFAFSPALSAGDIVSWTTNYTAEHPGVQNPAWVQYNTQPGATTPSTMPTLTVAGWSSNTQTVTVNGVTTTNNVLVAPAPASAADWTSAGVICTAQGTDSLTFTCTQIPSNDITVNVCILG